jgi:hypothetical protein
MFRYPLILLIVACAQIALAQRGEPAPRLTAEERRKAADLAEVEVKKQLNLGADDKLVLVSAELLSEKDPKARTALVYHYRYGADAAVLSTVDLTKGTITRVRVMPKLTLPLGAEEEELARKLASENEALKKVIGEKPKDLRISSLVARPRRGEPGFGHRIAHLFFRIDRRPLNQVAVVDLTAKSVTVVDSDKFTERSKH